MTERELLFAIASLLWFALPSIVAWRLGFPFIYWANSGGPFGVLLLIYLKHIQNHSPPAKLSVEKVNRIGEAVSIAFIFIYIALSMAASVFFGVD